MKERIKELIDINGTSERKKYKEFEEKTSIKSGTWKSVCQGVQRVNEDHIKSIGSIWPEYIFWIVTGNTLPEAGQTSPDGTGNRVSLRDAITSILESVESTGTLLTPKQTADLILEQLSTRKDDRVEDKKAI